MCGFADIMVLVAKGSYALPIALSPFKRHGGLKILLLIKDVKQAIRLMMQILEKLDEIYHALHDDGEKKE